MPAPTPDEIRQLLRSVLPAAWSGPDTFGHFKFKSPDTGRVYRIKVQAASLRFEACDRLPRYEGSGLDWHRVSGCPLKQVRVVSRNGKPFLQIGTKFVECKPDATEGTVNFADIDKL